MNRQLLEDAAPAVTVGNFWRGPSRDDAWERPALLCLLAAAAALYLWGLDANGWANPYYSAAAQAGANDWKAFFFGAFEWGNLITVDKTPLSLWVMSLSVRVFGLSSWSILVPQALMGVATTYLIHRVLRRGFGPRTALFGAALYATTPVVVLMSRFNNPEPLMGLLTVASVLVALKAMESGRLRSFALAGFLLGLGFMAKQVQALLVLPALGVAVLAFGHGPFTHRIRQLLVAGGTLLATSAAWLVTVDLIPAAQRPYIGGSLNNSAVELTLDYNGLARFIHIPMTAEGGRATTAQDDVSVGGDGLRRLLNGNFAPEIGWLLFTGVACCVVILVLNRSLDLTARQRNTAAIACLWFTSVLVVLASMGTMIHTYYTYSLAAPLALVVAIGLSSLWKQRHRMVVRALGAVLIGSSAYMALRVMEYSQEWPLWARLLVGLAGISGSLLWLSPRFSARIPRTSAVVLLGCLLLGPMGTALFTIGTPQQGTNPQSGPVGDDPASMSRLLLSVKAGQPPWAQQIALGAPPSHSVLDLLRNHSSGQQWAAATYSAQNAARYQLESGRPVIPLGGWLGTDPAPTLEQFQGLVAQHRVGYFIWQQDLLERGELSAETRGITDWVRSNFTEQVVDGVRLYDLRG
ncbi:glycosyltransferase family 39 protein [Pseudarthrobacter sulfonivorans]|uniref:ArnT family glycosyltransferase n=1 Tax=Pseudarthrobacter sulfonivorans TaxID=121292 RepID=UPI00295E915A|nr:glycosyltransferase family 39 protein [Pseudarthrobacter sulfonivorans]